MNLLSLDKTPEQINQERHAELYQELRAVLEALKLNGFTITTLNGGKSNWYLIAEKGNVEISQGKRVKLIDTAKENG